MSELIESVIEAGRAMGLQITSVEGVLTLVARRGRVLDPPVAFMITDEALREYFRGVAADAGEANAWEEWRMLMSTHLAESLYELDTIGGQAAIVIDASGFRAVSTTDPRANAGH
ncbi:hypothetical protein ACWDSJ_30355 [Nocardia sp. NPDC003482]|uniref:hypothetical protein n=1 Tax=Nocardia sp. NPDC004068 TaxID=3364303 RepID=UPI0036BD152C